MKIEFGYLLVLLIGSIFIASLLPSILTLQYDDATNTADYRWDNGIEDGTYGANDTASLALAKLFPLFTVLGCFGIIVVLVGKHTGYI